MSDSRIRKVAPCPGCGAEVYYIRCVDGKTRKVDPEPVWARKTGINPDSFISKEGRFFFGVQVGDAYEVNEDEPPLAEVFVPHNGQCPQGGRKRRINRHP